MWWSELLLIILIIIFTRKESYIYDCVCTSDILHVSLSSHNSLIAVAVQISSVKALLVLIT